MKIEEFVEKEPGKLDIALGVIFGIILFFAYRIGLAVGEKWPYVLLLILTIFIYILSWESNWLFRKFFAVLNISYSLFMLVFDKHWMDKWEKEQIGITILLFAFVFLGNIMAVASSIFVLIFGLIAGTFWRMGLYMIIYIIPRIPGFLRSAFWAKVRGPLPDVQSIVKGDKRVYLHKDYEEHQIQLIYRQGTRRRILDTYQWKEFLKEHYSLEWDSQNCVTVYRYDAMISKKVEEKKYQIS